MIDQKEIHDICKKYDIENYTINDDGSIDVNGDIYLGRKELFELPLKFNKVSGVFDCYGNNLTSLKGSPKEVGGGFYCYGNKLTTLEGCPKEVGGGFYCYSNKLTSLKGYNLSFDRLFCDNKDILIRKNRLNKIIKNDRS